MKLFIAAIGLGQGLFVVGLLVLLELAVRAFSPEWQLPFSPSWGMVFCIPALTLAAIKGPDW